MYTAGLLCHYGRFAFWFQCTCHDVCAVEQIPGNYLSLSLIPMLLILPQEEALRNAWEGNVLTASQRWECLRRPPGELMHGR